MRVLITGANGMVARAAIEHCRAIGDDVLAYTRQELDVSDASAVEKTLAETKPDALINCAAYTDVDGSESYVDLCYAVNAYGVEDLARAAKQNNITFVTISTDYVFDGKNTGFYLEDDMPNPLGVYGLAKFGGESYALQINSESIVVRSGWIYGVGGTNFLSKVHLLLAEGNPIKAISDSYGTPTFADDLAKRLRELAELKTSGIYHVTNSGNGTSYAGFARKVAEIKGYNQALITDVSSSTLQRPAPRPRSSKLGTLHKNLAPLPDWEKALRIFLTQHS